MKFLGKYLIGVVLLFGCFFGASAAEVQLHEGVAAESTVSVSESAKFEKLMQDVLDAKSPSLAKRAGVDFLREVTKYVSLLGLYVGGFKLNGSGFKYKNEILAAYSALAPVVVALSDHFIGPRDELLASLKNLEKSLQAFLLSKELRLPHCLKQNMQMP